MASTTPAHHNDLEAKHELSPLIRHLSMDDDDTGRRGKNRLSFRALVVVVALMAVYFVTLHTSRPRGQTVTPIEHAKEYLIDSGDGTKLWFRTWGTQEGIPILFVHGGPGQAVADYDDGNKRFFDASTFFVVEVDQRGTGNSQPSVRDDYHNMQLYMNITLDVFAQDYETIRNYLGLESWVVWGGSYGSTVSLHYAMTYPERCIALLLRGIFLETEAEEVEVYTKDAFKGNPRRTHEFNRLYQYAERDVLARGEPPLDPNDPKRLFAAYQRMIVSGDRMAIWSWHVFENNLMEEDPENRLDPEVIDEDTFPEAQSIAFFETHFWYHGTWENPTNLLDRVDKMAGIPVWICQGLRDEVCPPQHAQHLVDALEGVDGPHHANFVDSGHEDTDPVMAKCLVHIMNEFLTSYERPHTTS